MFLQHNFRKIFLLTKTENIIYNKNTPPRGVCIKEVIFMMADKAKIMRLLKTARGQIDGIIKMVEDDRYCIDISNQLMASQAVLKTANKEVLSAHLKHCVNNAESGSERDEKIDEFIKTISKMT